MQYPHESVSDSMVTVSLDGAYNISNHDGLDYAVRLYHDAQTFFRNTQLTPSRYLEDGSLSLIMTQEGLDADGREVWFQRSFDRKSDHPDES